MKTFDYIKYLIPIALALLLVVTCTRQNKKMPGTEYMPEMIHSLAYEYQKGAANSPEEFNDWATTLKPPKGSIPVGFTGYDLENTIEDYQLAATRLDNPVELTDEALARGKAIYKIHCTPCHGDQGNGEGSAVVGSEYRLAKPPIDFSNPQPGYLTPGRMFHVITYGKGLMGSYASQVSVEDRWNVIHYIQTLNQPNNAAATNDVEDIETDEVPDDNSDADTDLETAEN